MEPYDPRYLAGVVLFNAGDFFEAHEVWEDLWAENHGDERRFYQGLIQAAVGLCHFGNGNLRGAAKLYRSSRDYQSGLASPFRGLDLAEFWRQMEVCFLPVLRTDPNPATRPEESRLPRIDLNPPPAVWPDPAAFLKEEE
jgi:uncharacterized protein